MKRTQLDRSQQTRTTRRPGSATPLDLRTPGGRVLPY